jgi:flagellar hook-associated protein 1 FlgK
MSGLFDGLRVSLNSLSNWQTAMSVISDNVANVNTEGYSRKRVILESLPGEVLPYGTLTNGAEISRIQSVRDGFLERRILVELQELGTLKGQEFGLKQIESIFSGVGAGIPDQLSTFYNSFLELSADPSSIALRQGVISSGENLASAIRDTAHNLDTLDLDSRAQIKDSVKKVNELLTRIAQINDQLGASEARGIDGGALLDERNRLVRELSEEIGILTYNTESGTQVITTASGKNLLTGSRVTELEVADAAAGPQILYKGQDITTEIRSGKLGGYLSFQLNHLPTFKTALNTFAAELAAGVNAVHQNGIDLDGNAGGDFFIATPGNEARTISVDLSDPRTVAASAPGTGIGDGTIAQGIADLRDQKTAGLGDQSLNGFYSELIFEVGLENRFVEGSLETQSSIIADLSAQRESVSGVSLDEEAVNLLQFQRSYQASARVIQVIDILLEETINLIR